MKKPHTYILSVLLTLIVIFSLLGLAGASLLRFKALNPATFTQIVNEKALPARVQDELRSYFKEQENASGIPASVYDKAIAEGQLRPIIQDTVSNAFDYLNGKTDTLGITPDFSVLNADMTAFFEQYAADNGYEKDALYDETLAKAVKAGSENIQSACDVFRIGLLDQAGLLKKVRRVMPYLSYALFGALVMLVLAVILLVTVNHREKHEVCYWVGTAVLVSSLLMLVPAAYLQATSWFDRFAVKSDQVFAAVTGYLYKMTGTVITGAVIGLVLAVCLYLLRGVTRSRKRRPVPAA